MACKVFLVLTFCLVFQYSFQYEDVSEIDQEIRILEKARGKNEERKGCTRPKRDIIEWCSDDVTGDDTGPTMVSHGTMCAVSEDGVSANVYLCSNGEWRVQSLDDNDGRTKRIVKRSHRTCYRKRRWGRRRQRCSSPNHAPYFTRCKPSTTTFYTSNGASSMRVTWPIPTAYDLESGTLGVSKAYSKYKTGTKRVRRWWRRRSENVYANYPHYGDTFSGSSAGRSYPIVYRACDNSRSCRTCSFTITVKVVTCSVISLPPGGKVSCPDGTHYGKTCTFSCNTGFTQIIASTQCQSNGAWSHGSSTVCEAIICSNTKPSLANGQYSCPNHNYGTQCVSNCNSGFSINTVSSITCTENGWVRTGPTECKDANPPTISNCPTSMTFEAAIQESTAMVQWTEPSATDAEESTTPTMNRVGIAPGSINAEGTYLVEYQAFDSTGNPSEKCSFYVTVLVRKCPALPVVANAVTDCSDGTVYGSVCTFTCNHGYRLEGETAILCQETEDWSGTVPTCTEIICPSPQSLGHTFLNGFYECPDQITLNDACTSTCDDGYRQDVEVLAMCSVGNDGSLEYVISGTPQCIDDIPPEFPDCKYPVTLHFDAEKGTRHARVTWTLPNAVDNIDLSPTVQQTSGPFNGSLVEDSSNINVEFLATDAAKNPSEKCVYVIEVTVIECPALTYLSNGDIDSCDNIYGSICSHSCVPGYGVTGDISTECLADGTWSNRLECSVLHCLSSPPSFDNGEYICTDTAYNSWCQPVCATGFELEQGLGIRCDESQNWSQTIQPVCIDDEAPIILGCVPTVTITAGAGEVCAVVDVEPPNATDNVDQSVTVTKTSGPTNGDCIESDALLKYSAVDNAGNPSDVCVTLVKVTVVECPTPQWPTNGQYVCNKGYIYGSTCSIDCQEGFEASTDTNITCAVNGSWSYAANSPPSCSPISCGIPQGQDNGSFLCSDFGYQSVCRLECNQGFSTSAFVYATCEKNKQWSYSSSEQCTDTSPPAFDSCKPYQSFYIDRGETSASVTWEEPRATDNVDPSGNLTYQVTPSVTQGQIFPIGTTSLEYSVTDSAGNPSLVNCIISIVVEDIVCQSPVTAFSDVNLMFACPSFRYGIPCDVTCRNTSSKSFNLVGPTKITCEATFMYTFPTSNWDFNGTQPYCDEIQDVICQKNLHAPENGVITYSGTNQPVAFIKCNDKYDLPLDHKTTALCLDTGVWEPSTINDCVELLRPQFSYLTAEYTYSGNCADAEEEIKNKALAQLEQFHGSVYAPPCLATSTCGFDDITASCGNTTRRKRETESIIITIRLKVYGDVDSIYTLIEHEQILFELSDGLQQAADNGDFNIDGLVFVSYARYQYADTECTEPGTKFSAFKCLPCGKGRYMTTSSNGQTNCEDCPVGTYNDNGVALSCIQCPEGFSTASTAATSLEMCLEKCEASNISPNGFTPCTTCPYGSYQPQRGQTSCTPCQNEHTTLELGSTLCSAYDVKASPGSYEVPIIELTGDQTAISTSFWLHMSSWSGFRLLLSNSNNEIVSVGFFADWDTFDQRLNILNVQSPLNEWMHYVVILDSLITVIENGISINSAQLDSSFALTTGSRLFIQISSETDIKFSGFGMFLYGLRTDEITSLQSSCVLEDSANATVRTNDILSARGSVPIHADPATCIVTNYCSSSPCGFYGQCRPDTDGYVCVCMTGHSGTNCEVGPNTCSDIVCLNGGTCQDGRCICPNGYTGEFCGKAPVSGGWSVWSSWGDCSTSCDEGVRQRNRSCSSPPPDLYGEDCFGDSNEETSCNIISCADVNKCKDNPCGDPHKCMEQSDGYTCKCAAGYTGDHCEIQPESCAQAVCLNGGTCVSQENSFACQCPNSHTGIHCETEFYLRITWTAWSICSSSCNGGTSIRFTVCDPPSDDPVCSSNETRICNTEHCLENHCVSSPCGNHSCISSFDGFECICNAGYTGVTCLDVIDHCVNNGCAHGECVNLPSGYRCSCPEGYTGAMCNRSQVDGGWSVWNRWGPCSSSCGDGTQQRSRQCNNPAPSVGGRFCSGNHTETMQCNNNCEDTCAYIDCGDHGTCVPTDTDYSCHCNNGYTGPLCDTPPDQCDGDPCLNGGSCYSNETNFYCVCQAGFSGDNCAFLPVDSAWLTWGEWSGCSASCAGGEQTRERLCELGSNGVGCGGDDREVQTCNVENCPECDELKSPFGVIKDCNYHTDNQTTVCSFRCTGQYHVANSSDFVGSYQCGPETGFEWDQTAPLPSCSPSSLPKNIKVESKIRTSPGVSCANHDKVKEALERLLISTPCYVRSNCNITVQLDSCLNSRKKRQDDDATNISFIIEVDLEGFNSTDLNVTETMQQTEDEGVETLSIIESTTRDGIIVDGVTYSVESNNETFDVNVSCPDGYVLEDEAYCIGCSPGTMYDTTLDYCVSCLVGTYQEEVGKTYCDNCPSEHVHEVVGSWNRSDCEDISMFISREESDDTTPLGLIVGVSVGVVVAAMIGIGVIVYKKFKRQTVKVHVNEKGTQQKCRSTEQDCKSTHDVSRPISPISLRNMTMYVEDIENP